MTKKAGSHAGPLHGQEQLPLQEVFTMSMVSSGPLAFTPKRLMNILWNTTFENETVVIDGKHLVDCTLLNCTLEYSGGPVILERTELRGCHYVFRDQAQMTVAKPE